MRCLLIHDVSWPTLESRCASLAAAMNKKAPWLNLSIKTSRKALQGVKIEKHREGSSIVVIDDDWFDANVTDKGYDMTCLLLGKKEARKIGIKGAVGCHINDNDRYAEIWIVADENTMNRVRVGAKRFQAPAFEDIFEHELKHALYRQFGKTDNTHKHGHDKAPDKAWDELNAYAPKVAKPTAPSSQWGLLPQVHSRAVSLIEKLKAQGVEIKITEGLRTYERQQILWDQGRTKPGNIVTNAMPGYSMHNHGVAFDVYPVKDGWNTSAAVWEIIGRVGESLGLEWGGRWKGLVDKPHFEYALGHSAEDFAFGRVDMAKFN
jgi:peptidoglycan L-alanyl-D-glutamate endopeptidase CwlK